MKYFIPPTRVCCFLLLVVSVVHCFEPSNPSATVASSSYAKVKYANGQKNNSYRFAFQRDPTIQYVSAEDLRPKPASEDQVAQITPEDWKTVTDSKKIVVGSSKSSSVSVQTSDNHRYDPTTTTEQHQIYDTDPVQDHADQPDMWMQSSNEDQVLGNNFEKQATTEREQQNWASIPSSSSSVSMSSSVSSSSGTSGTQSQNTPLYRDEPHHISDSSDGHFSSETQGHGTTSSTEDPFGSDTAEYAHASDDNLGHLVTDPTPVTTTTRETTRTVTTTPTTTVDNTVTSTTTNRKKSTTTSTEQTYITDSHFSADNVQAKTELPQQVPQMTQRPHRPPTERKDDQSGFSIFAQELAPGIGAQSAQSAWRPFVGPPVKQVVSKKRPFNNRPVTLLINDATTEAPPPLFFKDPLPGSAVVGDNIQFGNNQGGTGMALFVPAPNPNDERVDSGVFGTIIDTQRPQFMQKPFSANPSQGPRPTPSGPLDLPAPSRDRIPQRPLQATAQRPPGLVTPSGKGDLDIDAILKDLKKKIPNGPVQINPHMVLNGNGGPPNGAPPQFQQRPQFQNPPPPNFQGHPPQGFGPQGPPQQGFGRPQGPPPQQGFGPQGPPQQGQMNGRPFTMNNSPNGPVRPGFNPQVIADRNDVPGTTFFNPQQQNKRFPESNMIIPPNQQQFPPNFRPPMMRPQFPPQQQQQQPASGNFFRNLWNRFFGRSLQNPEDVPIVDVDSLYNNGTLPTEIYQHLANSTYAEAVDTLSKLGYGNFTFTEEPTISNSTEAN